MDPKKPWQLELDTGTETRYKLRCKVCGDVVFESDIRNHLFEHSMAAFNLDWADVRNEFEIVDED